VRKKSGPSLRLKLPELVDCSDCSGKGVIKGMFHKMICNRCDGSGVVTSSGDPIDRDTMVAHMKVAIAKLRQQNKQLQIENQLYREKFGDHEAAGHFEDFKTINGGRYRGD